MGSLKLLLRTFFKKGKYNLIKILSLSVGLALGLVLIAQVYFEQSYNDFFPDKERIYMVMSNYTTPDMEDGIFTQTSGAVVVGMKAEMPEIEAATRFTWLTRGYIVTPDKKRYDTRIILADSCLFDIFPQEILIGDVKEVLSRPMYALVSKEIAEKMGGIDQAVGQTFYIDSRPGRSLTIGGVFEDIPNNSHLSYNVVVSLNSIDQFMGDGSLNWVGNDRYMSYVKLYPDIKPENLKEGIEKTRNKYLPLNDLKKAGVDINWSLKPLAEIHIGDENTKRMVLIFSILALALIFTAVMNYVLIVISSLVNRSREMAVNKCYGASEKDIYFRMLLETLFDLIISVVFALLIILISRGMILSLLGTTLYDLFTGKSILLLLTVCVIVFFVAALLPGYLYARIPIAVAFRNFSESKRYWKLGLLFIQFIAAGFFITLLVIIGRQYNYMLNDDPGYDYDNIAYSNLSGVDSDLRQKALEEVKRLPNVVEVTTSTQLLFNGASGNNIYLPGDERDLFNIADLEYVGNNYLDFMGIPIIEGRSFIEDTPSSTEVMVSRSFVEKMMNYADWSDGAVGKSIYISYHSKGREILFTICGVYEDFRLGIIGGQDTRPTIMLYSNVPRSGLLIKFHKETPEALTEVSDVLTRLLPDKVVEVYSYSGEMMDLYRDSKNFRNSVMIAGIVTLIICLIGLIGYTNDEMNRRKKETAIRKVNGATILDIERLFLRDISWMALPSITLGCMIAYFVANSWLEKFADKLELTLFVFIGCGLMVLLIILAAVAINCYRAASENPAESVKSE